LIYFDTSLDYQSKKLFLLYYKLFSCLSIQIIIVNYMTKKFKEKVKVFLESIKLKDKKTLPKKNKKKK